MNRLKTIKLAGLAFVAACQAEIKDLASPTVARFGEDGAVARFVQSVEAQKLSRSLESFVLSNKSNPKAILACVCKIVGVGALFGLWLYKSRTKTHILKAQASRPLHKSQSLGGLAFASASTTQPSNFLATLLDLLSLKNEDPIVRFARMVVYLHVFQAMVSSTVNWAFGSDICAQASFDKLVKHIKEQKLLELPDHPYIKHLVEIIYKGQDCFDESTKIELVRMLRSCLIKIKSKKQKPLEILFFVDGQYYAKEV